jgi:hypothetical protein
MRRRLTAMASIALFAAAGSSLHPAQAAPSPTAVPIVWTDLDGRGYGPIQLKAAAATVFVFFSTQCPVSESTMPRIRALAQRSFSRRVAFFLVNANSLDSAAKIRSYAQERHLLMPLVKDSDAALADRLGATLTPEAVVVDRAGQIRYRGQIDDNPDPALVRSHDLQAALDAILAGRSVAASHVRTAGCFIVRLKPAAPAQGAAITYTRDVAPILNRQCVSCHRPGEVAPFSLATYGEARVWARQIKDVTSRHIMPPWKPVAGFGAFQDQRALTPRELTILTRWADSGAPEGDLRQAPKPPAFTAGWTLGKPDLILSAKQPFAVKAEGRDQYRDFILPVDFTQDTYVSLTQIRPDRRAVVHHVIVYIDAKDETLKLAGADPNASFDNPNAGVNAPIKDLPWLVGWAPGNTPHPAPPGTAVRIPKGAKLVMEVHYHPSGEALIDHTEIGLTFARHPVQKQILVRLLAQPLLPLEPNRARIPVIASTTLSEGEMLYAIAPHMHRIGREMQVWATLPDGHRIDLIWLKDWDFNWQETYFYRQPIHLPKDTKLELVAYYDNSARNPRNPNQPPKRITWGEQTTDEMCIAFFNVTRDAEQLNVQPPPPGSTVLLPTGSTLAAAPRASR